MIHCRWSFGLAEYFGTDLIPAVAAAAFGVVLDALMMGGGSRTLTLLLVVEPLCAWASTKVGSFLEHSWNWILVMDSRECHCTCWVWYVHFTLLTLSTNMTSGNGSQLRRAMPILVSYEDLRSSSYKESETERSWRKGVLTGSRGRSSRAAHRPSCSQPQRLGP